jgi:hypothetical protein
MPAIGGSRIGTPSPEARSCRASGCAARAMGAGKRWFRYDRYRNRSAQAPGTVGRRLICWQPGQGTNTGTPTAFRAPAHGGLCVASTGTVRVRADQRTEQPGDEYGRFHANSRPRPTLAASLPDLAPCLPRLAGYPFSERASLFPRLGREASGNAMRLSPRHNPAPGKQARYRRDMNGPEQWLDRGRIRPVSRKWPAAANPCRRLP